jgi:hypothetical protein
MDAIVLGVCVESKNNTCPKKSVRFVSALFLGARNGLPFGTMSNTAAIVVARIKTKDESSLVVPTPTFQSGIATGRWWNLVG